MESKVTSSFWLPFILELYKPETLKEQIFIIVHAMLIDNGFIFVKPKDSIQNQKTENFDANANFEFPLIEKEGGLLLEIMPLNWRSKIGKHAFYYLNKNLELRERIDDIKDPLLKVELIMTDDSIVIIANSTIAAQECLTFGFPLTSKNNYKDEKLFIKYIVESIQENLINKLLNCEMNSQQNIGSYIKEMHSKNITSSSRDSVGLSEGNTILPNMKSPNMGYDRFLPLDPLMDDKGIRGSLVGPNSSIFKKYSDLFIRPKYIPTSSIPGNNTTPDNDMFFPPGKKDFNMFD